MIDRREVAGDTHVEQRRIAALEQLADAVQRALPELRRAEHHGATWARELEALELAIERLNPVPPPSS